jgi:hypothetical protein
VRIPNEPEDDSGKAFGELLRIQSEFHTRLAEEALKYLHRLQGTAMPASPGTVMMPGSSGASEFRAAGRAGASVELRLEVENRQRVHCSITPMLTPLVGASGVTWFPAVESSPAITLLAPDEIAALVINVALPPNLPAGTYKGALTLQGFREGAIPVAIGVTGEGGDDKDEGGDDYDAKANARTTPAAQKGAGAASATGARDKNKSSSKKKAATKTKDSRSGSAKRT